MDPVGPLYTSPKKLDATDGRDPVMVAAVERARRLARIRRLMATTPDWQRWFSIDWERMELHVK
jgi:hypothetical protein